MFQNMMKLLSLFDKRKSAGMAIAILAILLIGMLIYPVGYGIIRLGIVVSVILIYLGILYLVWHRRFLKYSWIALAIAFCVVIISPGRPSDAIALRDRYVRKLIEYDRVVYVYGGENEFGIDCSGLVREARVA
jgi:Zn-dependent protease with chaperone function